jgi:hypothetical protein
MERIEVMRLALETLVAMKQFPKSKLKSEATKEVRDIAGTYAMYLNQEKKKPEQAAAVELKYCYSPDLASSLYAQSWL